MTITVLTENPYKMAEMKAILGRHGAKVAFASPEAVPRDFITKPGDFVLRETSNIYNIRTGKVSAVQTHMEAVHNRSTVTAWYLEPDESGEISSRLYTGQTEGYIDLNRRAKDSDVFGWDDVFVMLPAAVTYDEMRRRGLKCSARDKTVSRFTADFLHFDDRLRLNWSETITHRRSIDFEDSAVAFVRANPYFQVEGPIAKAFAVVLQQGVVFRAAGNRREKNYWLPGLNGGVPFVPKRDSLHEATFMAHDFMHFLMPDPVYAGETYTGGAGRKAYCAFRMISEAISLTLADMVFVDQLKAQGHHYDWGKRKIHPLYESMKANLSDGLAGIRRAAWAVTRFALLGDDTEFLLLDADQEALEAFKEKYGRFFIEDYRWTAANFDRMAANADLMRAWATELYNGRADFTSMQVPWLSDFVEDRFATACGEDIVEAVFTKVWDTRIEPALSGYWRAGNETLQSVADVDEARALGNAFRRYMAGQTTLFTKYGTMPGAGAIAAGLVERVMNTPSGHLDIEEIKQIRGTFDMFVDSLERTNVLSPDDAAVFKEVHPLFDPFYVFYESKFHEVPDLPSAARLVFNRL